MSGGLCDDAETRRAFREFVHRHHPDVGGDPEVFVAGLAAFGRGTAPGRAGGAGSGRDPRFDAPVTVVRRPRGLAGLAVWLRERRAARHRPSRVR